jgi:hypothetical protein
LDTVARDSEQRRIEELWMPSARAYQQRKEEEHRAAWCEHYRRMRGVHWGLGDEYDAKLRELENGHHEEHGGRGVGS